MGCPENFDNCYEKELPRTEVKVSPFKIMKYQVTVGAYEKCVRDGTCNNDHPTGQHYATFTIDPSCNLFSGKSEDHPMNCVSWYGARAFCSWKGMRLPTEAEWEYAARGNDGRIYPWGNEDPSCRYAVMTEESRQWGCGKNETWPVGSKPEGASFFGLKDMAGNLWEWVEDDWFDSNERTEKDQRARIADPRGSHRVIKGGAYTYGGNSMRSSAGQIYAPYIVRSTNGFRCAK